MRTQFMQDTAVNWEALCFQSLDLHSAVCHLGNLGQVTHFPGDSVPYSVSLGC